MREQTYYLFCCSTWVADYLLSENQENKRNEKVSCLEGEGKSSSSLEGEGKSSSSLKVWEVWKFGCSDGHVLVIVPCLLLGLAE